MKIDTCKTFLFVDGEYSYCLINHGNHFLQGTKIYGKESLKFVPTMGWSWIFVESIFLKRDWTVDKKRIHDGVKELVEFPDGYWFTVRNSTFWYCKSISIHGMI